jgi:hypothetical protein
MRESDFLRSKRQRIRETLGSLDFTPSPADGREYQYSETTDEETGEVLPDFDSFTEQEAEEFRNEYRTIFKKMRNSYPHLDVPYINNERPKHIYEMYNRLMDMIRSDRTTAIYMNILLVGLWIFQTVTQIAGLPTDGFYEFHRKQLYNYHDLMVILGEKYGSPIKEGWSVEVKLTLFFLWNSVVFIFVKFVEKQFGDTHPGLKATIADFLDSLTKPKNRSLEETMETASDDVRARAEGTSDKMTTGIDNLATNLSGLFSDKGGASALIGGLSSMFSTFSGMGGGGGASSAASGGGGGAAKKPVRPKLDPNRMAETASKLGM